MAYVTVDRETLQQLANIARSYAHDAQLIAKRAEQRGEGFDKIEMYTTLAKDATKHADVAQQIVSAAWRAERGHTWRAERTQKQSQSRKIEAPRLKL
jgi:hypothetical protein